MRSACDIPMNSLSVDDRAHTVCLELFYSNGTPADDESVSRSYHLQYTHFEPQTLSAFP